jgi:hypothetical protein
MEAYSGKQFVGIDLHRRRSVTVSSTGCATVTYEPWNTCRGWREHRLRLPLVGAGRAGHDPRCGVVAPF